MKKLMIALAALMTFGIASAQTDPKQVPQAQPPASTADEPVTTKSEVKQKNEKKPRVETDKMSNQKLLDPVPPRKDELKTRSHVKSTQETRQDTAKAATKNRKKRT